HEDRGTGDAAVFLFDCWIPRSQLTFSGEGARQRRQRHQSYYLPIDETLPMQMPEGIKRWDETAATSMGCVAHRLLNGVGTVYLRAPTSQASASSVTDNAVELAQVS